MRCRLILTPASLTICASGSGQRAKATLPRHQASQAVVAPLRMLVDAAVAFGGTCWVGINVWFRVSVCVCARLLHVNPRLFHRLSWGRLARVLHVVL